MPLDGGSGVSDSVIVDRTSFPTVHAAFVAIEHDNGGHLIGTVYPGKPINLDSFEVPAAWAALLPAAEAGLARLRSLSAADWETFVIGELSEMEAIRDRQGDLAVAQTILNDHFDGWQPEDAPAAIAA